MLHIGLDAHWRTSSICILSEHGRVVKRKTIRGHWSKTVAYLAGLDEKVQVCFEASCGYGVLYDRLRAIGARVVVAHPGLLRLIFRTRRKSDRIDAEKLAKLLYLGEVPQAYVPSESVRSWREMIEYRRRLVDKRVRTKNALRTLLRSHGVEYPRALWTRAGRRWLAEVALPNEWAALRREMLLEELATFDGQIARVTKQLDEVADHQPAVTLLRTIPGVGPRTAEAVAAYVDDAHRFGPVARVGSYFGLVPCEDTSAGTRRLGHITKTGPATARKLLVEAAWQVIRRDAGMRAVFERIQGGKRERRKTALVAVARKLLVRMTAMLKSGEAWRAAA